MAQAGILQFIEIAAVLMVELEIVGGHQSKMVELEIVGGHQSKMEEVKIVRGHQRMIVGVVT